MAGASPPYADGAIPRPGGGVGTVAAVVTWKKALLVALVVLVVLIGVPVLMPGMGGAATCTDCPPAVVHAQVCTLAAVLSTFALAVIVLSQRVRQRGAHACQLLFVPLLERPPQPA